MRTPLLFNAFVMNTPSHLSPGLWTHPDDHGRDYKRLAHWTGLARLLEEGLFDALFIADSLGVSDVFGGNADTALQQAIHVPINDPFPLVSAMAVTTEHLGFGVTASVSYDHPVPFARRITTLDHLTDGRIGWNIVTSSLASAARNFGRTQLDHDARYELAEEFASVCYKLWEASWEDDAVRDDTKAGVYADPAKVHPIHHAGRFFEVPGIHLSEPSPQRTPLLFQAGASERGRRFAARHAECVFVGAPSKTVLKRSVSLIRDARRAAGLDPYGIRILAEHTVIAARDLATAQERLNAYRAHASASGALALMSGWIGHDLSRYGLDEPFRHIESNGIRTAVEAMSSADPNKVWTIGEIASWCGIGGLSPLSVGGPGEVADSLESWAEETDIDGFNLSYAVLPGSFRDFIEHAVPELQRRGLYKKSYAEGTLRRKLFGRDRLDAPHPAGLARAEMAASSRESRQSRKAEEPA
ncbi:FMN-dependent oxidoreductase, nitrilotriacetate monooxygenase family [Arboricoccus pini]|uniref:FMN-dependent oxidoreductase, nitrilotriacetate monooxygenase family n=1 Tax=Arboricoccus pini TaxID=1963835 RepID=A0A212S3G2_9PROT|nr:LLM class flavin-dependent oxidoreductase [Arboricoccus pini]SNB79660.1 FMN-dependent oxidoreductase, nitrilotriacetate monooxygenase family [Arboricoccus pini]